MIWNKYESKKTYYTNLQEKLDISDQFIDADTLLYTKQIIQLWMDLDI